MRDQDRTKRIRGRLRTLFERRDRLAKELADQDARINVGIRDLCDSEGTKFMRLEAARRIAFEAETEAA